MARRRVRPRVAIIGAGPVGLEAALAALERDLPFTVYEMGERPAANVRAWGHVRLFSPWSLDVSTRMRTHLERAGREVPDGDACPTGRELVSRILEPVASLEGVAERLRLGTRVVQVAREGMLKNDAIGDAARADAPFRLLLRDGDGREWVERADLVLDCSGSYTNPNPTGDGGIPAPGEGPLDAEIRRTIPDVRSEADGWAGRTTLLVGNGHSAWTAVRDLAALAEERPGTRVIWSIRRGDADWSGIPDDPLPERSLLAEDARALAHGASPAVELRADTVVEALGRGEDGLEVTLRNGDGGVHQLTVDRILSLTGYVGDHSLYRQLQVHECWATSGPMKLAASLLADASPDCLAQEAPGVDTLRSPEPDFFILGVKSFGRNSAFLMRTGWEQVNQVFGGAVGP